MWILNYRGVTWKFLQKPNGQVWSRESQKFKGISHNQSRSLRELSESEIRDMLMGKARIKIHKKLQGQNMAAVQKSSGKEAREKPTSSLLRRNQLEVNFFYYNFLRHNCHHQYPELDHALGSLPSASTNGRNTEATDIVTPLTRTCQSRDIRRTLKSRSRIQDNIILY